MSERTTDNLPEEGTVDTNTNDTISFTEMKERTRKLGFARFIRQLTFAVMGVILILEIMRSDASEPMQNLLGNGVTILMWTALGVTEFVYHTKQRQLERQRHQWRGYIKQIVSDAEGPRPLVVTVSTSTDDSAKTLRIAFEADDALRDRLTRLRDNGTRCVLICQRPARGKVYEGISLAWP